MKQIQLTKGFFAVVDDEDYEALNAFKWRLGSRNAYAVRAEKGKMVQMHRVILGLEKTDPRVADHIDGDTLNNTRANLRAATRSQNAANIHLKKTSGYKGVTFHKKAGKYQAALHGIYRTHIGLFDTAEEAALAYNETATRIYGEYAGLNKIGSPHE